MIKIKNIKKNYGKKNILTDITFSAQKGECIGILGCNGSGKSTLFNILAGVLQCDSGAFFYDEVNLFTNEKKRADKLGYVPQNTPLFNELTAFDNLRLWYDKTSLEEELSNGVLKLLGIDKFVNVPVYKMSGGMKKRLSIGCSVAKKPDILLLDEPSAALDLVCKESICDYLMQFKNNGGIILLATHDVHELDLCDKLYILKNGELAPYSYSGDIKELARCLQNG